MGKPARLFTTRLFTTRLFTILALLLAISSRTAERGRKSCAEKTAARAGDSVVPAAATWASKAAAAAASAKNDDHAGLMVFS